MDGLPCRCQRTVCVCGHTEPRMVIVVDPSTTVATQGYIATRILEPVEVIHLLDDQERERRARRSRLLAMSLLVSSALDLPVHDNFGNDRDRLQRKLQTVLANKGQHQKKNRRFK